MRSATTTTTAHKHNYVLLLCVNVCVWVCLYTCLETPRATAFRCHANDSRTHFNSFQA